MSTVENKLNLVQMIIESDDQTFIKKLLQYARTLKKSNSLDDSEIIPEHILDEIQASISELDNGTDKGTSHELILEKFKKEYPSLNL